jgi:hypothetical protein
MDIKNFNRKLHKISSLAENANDDNDLTALEHDLLLSYIRDLYEIALDHKVSEPARRESKPVVNPITDRPQVEQIQPVTPSVVHVVKEIVVETPPQVVVAEEQTARIEIQHIEPEKIIEKPIEVINTIKKAGKEIISQEIMDELFAEERISDLSDKLSLSPIKDLTKSMGINEKIFTQQELFGNNQQQFITTLEKLNNCQNFTEAKQYLLENVINDFGWTSEGKVKKAATLSNLSKGSLYKSY